MLSDGMPTLADTTVLDAFRRWGYLEAQLDPVPDAPHLLGLDRRRVHAHRRPQGAPRRAAARGRRAAAQHAPGIDVEPLRWDFLTGSRDAIHSLSREGFKLGLSDAAEEDGGPVHTTRSFWWIAAEPTVVTTTPSRRTR